MLVFFAILLVVAVSALIGFMVRREVVKTLSEKPMRRELPQPQYRPLFQPDDEELRAEARAEAEQLKEIERQESLKQTEEKLALFGELRQTWAQSPNRGSTIELLYEASQVSDGSVYLETCEQIVALWRARQIAELSAADLAHLLESHFWLLPDRTRTPGVSFRLKEEIAGLRRESEENV
jgi:hypothetical protein